MKGCYAEFQLRRPCSLKPTTGFYLSALCRLRTSRRGFDNGVCLRDALGFGKMKRRRVYFQWLTRGFPFADGPLPLLQRGRFRFRSHNFTARDDEAQVEPNAHLWWRRVQEAGRLPVLQERHRAGGEPRRRRTCDASLGSSAGGSQALWQRG